MLPKKKKQTARCIYSIATTKDIRSKADELGKRFDRSRSKIHSMALTDFYERTIKEISL